MNPTIKVTQMRDQSAAIKQAFKALEKEDVLVGIPSDTAARGDGFSNAEIAYVQENGSPVNNIPARAFLRPGIEKYLPEAIVQLKDAAGHALRGNVAAVRQKLGKIGVEATNSVKAMFTANDWPALSEGTLRQRAARQAKSDRAGGKKPGKKLRRANPLIDSGQLRRAITYVIRGRR